MKKLLLLVSFSLLTAACGHGDLDKLTKLKDEACACKDKACADAAHDKYIAWKKGNSKDDKPSESQMKRFSELRTQLNECRHKLDAPPAAPEAPPAAPAAPEGSAAAPATP